MSAVAQGYGGLGDLFAEASAKAGALFDIVRWGMRNPAVGLRTNVRPYGKAAHCFSLIGSMNSLFFIDPNNELIVFH